jgi:hypothetical protein
VDKNTTVVFPAPLMSTIEELGSFLAREKAASTRPASMAAALTVAPRTIGPDSAVPLAPVNGGTSADAT